MLDNRELAALIWVCAAALWVLASKSVREGFAGVVKAFFKPQILIPLAAMLGWVNLELWIGVRLAIWNFALVKGTILWTLGSAGVLLFNCTQFHSDSTHYFFRRTVLATLGVAVFVEFFVNLYVMSLPVELVLWPLVVVTRLIVTVGGQKPEYKAVTVICERVLAVVGLAMLAYAARQTYLDSHHLDARELLLEFTLPIWLTLGLLPFLYFFSLIVVYDTAFRRISWDAHDRQSRWRSKVAMLSVLHIRTSDVQRFTGYFANQLREARTFRAARRVVKEFLDELERAEQAKIDEEERLRRYSGSQEVDEEGRRLDRREFAETTAALRWLATCQMGWHRRGDHYRCDILKILGDDFTHEGLPRESGIKVHVAHDGKSWYAWRRTVTGWCFAIGAAGPPPDQWYYDGPEPPVGFPVEDCSWGDGPFSDQFNRNW